MPHQNDKGKGRQDATSALLEAWEELHGYEATEPEGAAEPSDHLGWMELMSATLVRSRRVAGVLVC